METDAAESEAARAFSEADAGFDAAMQDGVIEEDKKLKAFEPKV